MKKILLASSALIAVASFAVAGEAPKLAISGSMNEYWDLYSVSGKTATGAKLPKSGTTVTGQDIIAGTVQVVFAANGKTDSGLNYGAKTDFRPLGSNVDSSYLTLGGDSWGSFNFGAIKGASNGFYADASFLAGTGFWDGDGKLGSKAVLEPQVSGAENKVRYTSPKFSGISFGASYAPSTGVGALNAVTDLAAAYDMKAGDVSVSTHLTRSSGKADNKTNRNSTVNHADVTVGFGAATVTAGWYNKGKSGLAKTNTTDNAGRTINFGTGYTVAGVNLGLGVASTAQRVSSRSAKEVYYGFGATSSLADGLTAKLELDQAKQSNYDFAGSKTTQNQVLVGLGVSF